MQIPPFFLCINIDIYNMYAIRLLLLPRLPPPTPPPTPLHLAPPLPSPPLPQSHLLGMASKRLYG
eukprot:333326-Hanusia_phi.AAC.1